MGQLMGEGEHLSRLSISAVNEHNWRQIVRQRKAPEFVWVELAIIVAAYDSIDHHEDAEPVCQFNEAAQRLGPGRALPPILNVEMERVAHRIRRFFDVAFHACRANERKRLLAY